MTTVPPTPAPSTDPRSARVPLGTRLVRDRLGIDAYYTLAARHQGEEVFTALAALVVSIASRLDYFDEQLARETAQTGRDAARAAADPDAHLGLSGAWSHVATQAPRIETGLARLGELRETLNAVLATYTRALAAHTPTTADTGADTGNAAAHPPA
ncbi:hypothetical protein OG216_08675 [Streptomycetaceae bacterium NBC_01309]